MLLPIRLRMHPWWQAMQGRCAVTPALTLNCAGVGCVGLSFHFSPRPCWPGLNQGQIKQGKAGRGVGGGR